MVSSKATSATKAWEMVPKSGSEAAGVGPEFLVLDDDGRIRIDYQFIEG